MDDAAILARLDAEPDAFGVFYRRHVLRLLDPLVGRFDDPQLAADVCAETFAAALLGAHRFDPERGSAAAWLDGIARRLVARAERHGRVDDRARRRLGMARLDARDGFARDLEEELVDAARFRASRRPLHLPRPSRHAVRGAVAGLAVLALVAAVAAVALNRGDAAGERAATPLPSPADDDFRPLVPMLAAVDCGGKGVRTEPASPVMPDIGVLQRGQRAGDALPGALLERLPLETLDRSEPRRARNLRMATRLHVVPSLAVSVDGQCDSNAGPGVCLVVARGSSFRCFTLADVRAGRAVTRTPDGVIVGIVPDGIPGVTVIATGIVVAPVSVVGNVYEADFGVPAGTPVRIELPSATAGCEPVVSSRLLERVATLRRAPPEGRRVPRAALDHVRGADPRIGAVAEDGARLWGGSAGVEFWVVPVVSSDRPDCAPANRVCIVAVPEGARPDALCLLDPDIEGWRLAPLYAGNAVAFGIVPDRTTGARVTIGDQSATVEAKDNVMAGMLPFPHDDFAATRVDPTYARDPQKPRVGVVDAAGPQGRYYAGYILRRLGEAGYPTLDAITPGIKAQPGTDLYWWPGRTRDLAIGRLARLLGVDRVIRIDDPDRLPRPVLRTDAPIVVVAGERRPSPG